MIFLGALRLTMIFFAGRDKGKIVLSRIPGYSIPTDPTYLPFKLQHSILTQTQRLLEECCYDFAGKWFPSILEDHGWDTPEAVELNKWWMTLRKYDIPAAAIAANPDQSLSVLFKRAASIRDCAVHRRAQIPVKIVEQMVRDAWLLSQALKEAFASCTAPVLAYRVGESRHTLAIKNRVAEGGSQKLSSGASTIQKLK